MLRYSYTLLLFIFLGSCSVFHNIPQPEREFRGFWVATVVNIDWPKNGNDAIEKKKADYLKILDFYQSLNFNAAIVQVRTAGDAFYESKFAPWSRFLTGEEGQSPNTGENILQWMVDETHARGMEFHAWLNPYRATFDLNTKLLSPKHDFKVHPEWMLKYGKKYYYDPGLPAVQQRMVSVIDEIVSKYDIDAIHFDDYFYPYTIKDEVFQDSISYYNCALPNQSLGDWRRSNIDSLIKKSHAIIKKRKPWVEFGVSPFGVWKNKATDPRGSDTKAGQTTYENLYADPLLWMEKGWLDYIVPQVYWSMDLSVASHKKIVDWWSKEALNTKLYIGNGPYKIRKNSDTAWHKKKELPDQIRYARANKTISGNALFSAKSLMIDNKDVVRHLKKRFYSDPVMPPIAILQPKKSENGHLKVQSIDRKNEHTMLTFENLENIHYAMVYKTGKTSKQTYPVSKLLIRAFIRNEKEIYLRTEFIKRKKRVALVFVDKSGQEYEPKIIHLKQTN